MIRVIGQFHINAFLFEGNNDKGYRYHEKLAQGNECILGESGFVKDVLTVLCRDPGPENPALVHP
jgi:hypothetical protein